MDQFVFNSYLETQIDKLNSGRNYQKAGFQGCVPIVAYVRRYKSPYYVQKTTIRVIARHLVTDVYFQCYYPVAVKLCNNLVEAFTIVENSLDVTWKIFVFCRIKHVFLMHAFKTLNMFGDLQELGISPSKIASYDSPFSPLNMMNGTILLFHGQDVLVKQSGNSDEAIHSGTMIRYRISPAVSRLEKNDFLVCGGITTFHNGTATPENSCELYSNGLFQLLPNLTVPISHPFVMAYLRDVKMVFAAKVQEYTSSGNLIHYLKYPMLLNWEATDISLDRFRDGHGLGFSTSHDKLYFCGEQRQVISCISIGRNRPPLHFKHYVEQHNESTFSFSIMRIINATRPPVDYATVQNTNYTIIGRMDRNMRIVMAFEYPSSVSLDSFRDGMFSIDDGATHTHWFGTAVEQTSAPIQKKISFIIL